MHDQPVAIATRDLVIYPGMIRVLAIARPASIQALEHHLEGAPLLLVPQLDPEEADPLSAKLASTGCLAAALRVSKLPDGSVRVLVEGQERARRTSPLTLVEGATSCQVEQLEGHVADPVQLGALAQELAIRFGQFTTLTGVAPHEHWAVAATPDDPERLADQVISLSDVSLSARIHHLAETSVDGRVQHALDQLAIRIAREKIHVEVNEKVQQAMDKAQREYQLKEQLKAIQKELGQAAGPEADAQAFMVRIEQSGMPDEARKEAVREAGRLSRVHADSAEYSIIRTWLETICDIPWTHTTEDRTSLKGCQRVLDRDHHGLAKVKERILEYLAVRQLAPQARGAILCFVGPPGVGKTSLGRSIADAMGRTYARIALGGVKDETEVRGHRRTYIGALPGRFIRALIRAGSKNPVLVLDEIDKVGNDTRGDPASALLEVLDPEQNSQFADHYLDVSVDLSPVMFIATANRTDTIPPALLDRLEIIELPGYTEEEKVVISRKHLLPRLAARHGLTGAKAVFQRAALECTIRDYTREAGVRELERQLAAIHRKIARQVVEGEVKSVRVNQGAVRRYLGPAKYHQDLAELELTPGVVTGLAWTASGGDILFVEAAKLPGKNHLKLTGSLGDVMKESAEAALSWLRSHAAELGQPAEAFEANFHLHVPAGAIPKDGPSAGVTMVTCLASLVSGRPVKPRLAMTGEITLRGKVLPVGGVKEKALAARRAGVTTILLPRHNADDLLDIPEELRADLTFHFVDRVEQVLELALL